MRLPEHGLQESKGGLFGYLNATFQTGFSNPMDKAICEANRLNAEGYSRLDEVPYDFIRKRLTVLVSDKRCSIMITKGAVDSVLAICSAAEIDGERKGIEQVREQITSQFTELNSRGFRTLGVAWKGLGARSGVSRADEQDMIFLGLLVFFDAPKSGVQQTIAELASLGVELKIITGDNALVASYVGEHVGLSSDGLVRGAELGQMSGEALQARVNEFHIFAEIDPNQKERIILALKKAGNVVGYMGDGINDAPALHAADVGISVDTAVDVAKDTADLVLLDKVFRGPRWLSRGPSTFANR